MEQNIEKANSTSSSKDGINLYERTYRMDDLFPAIDSFENFPEIVLSKIFTYTDDLGLLHMATMNSRFERIAKQVFQERYEDKYFVVEGGTTRQKVQYSAQLSNFGQSIKAIEIRNINGMNIDHWMVQLMHKHLPNLLKVNFTKCSFGKIDDLLSQHSKITHLILQETNVQSLCLPEHRNLLTLHLSDVSYFDKQSLAQILSNNPQMESLILKSNHSHFTIAELMEIIYKNLKHLKELILFDCYVDRLERSWLMDEFVNSIESVESFGIVVGDSTVFNLLKRVSSKCKHIKRLELCFRFNNIYEDEVNGMNCVFENVEELSLIGITCVENIGLIVQRLPSLRTLSISDIKRFTAAQTLSLLWECKHLERIRIDSYFPWIDQQDDLEDEHIDKYKINVQFHDAFCNIIQNERLKIEFAEEGETIGHVTMDEIVWRNKLLHWVDCNPFYSQSKVQLLDLADISKKSIGKHKQPLNLIFNYLDLHSLYTFSRANKQCKQIVHNHIYQRCQKSRAKQRSMKRGILVFNDEFGVSHNSLRLFGKCINNLEINLINNSTCRLISEMEKHCKNLTTICMRKCSSLEFIFAQVRHCIYYGCGEGRLDYCDLEQLANRCPNLETLDIKVPIRICNRQSRKVVQFRNLQKIKFIPFNEEAEKCALDFFKDTNTKVIIYRQEEN